MPPIARSILVLAGIWAGIVSPVAQAQELPDFGSPADSVLTKSREKLLGRSVIQQLREAGAIFEDPQLTEYIRLLGGRLAGVVNQDGDFAFEFFIIDDNEINAFAMPGGVIGVNAGLLLETENESELAAVIAHEVSHVTQRHIARSIYDQQRSGILSMATALAALLIGSATDSGSEAAIGVATAAQAAAAQRQINFTRTHESEADRIGMDVLARSGFDPAGMASFFEKLSRRESASADLIPEMLKTHPSGTGRIAESRARARQLPTVIHEDSIGYGLARARIRVLSAARPEDALSYFQARFDSDDPAVRYGLALSLQTAQRNDQAARIFRELSEQNPGVIAYRIGHAEALIAAGHDQQAFDVYQAANTLSPRNTPLVISFAESLIQMRRPDEAHALLLDLLNNVRPSPAQIELLARAANAEGDLVNAHHYMSEYFASVGNLKLAIDQLRQALAQPGVNSVQRERFNARIGEFEEFLEESEAG